MINEREKINAFLNNLQTDRYGQLTVKGARDVLDFLVEKGFGNFELLIGYDSNFVYTGFTNKIEIDGINKQVMVKEK
ncbi:hypothetical protein [Methanobrevibacter sp.]